AHISFWSAAVGIPLLVYGFYISDMAVMVRTGGGLVLVGLIMYLINTGMSIVRSKRKNIHAMFIFIASIWLVFTASSGWILAYNFEKQFLTQHSLHYLPMHAHAGIAGWFLLLVIGVASRLIPMFLISKYSNAKLLWVIFALINSG